uniref:Uncharacterized protein n=1 Tax=Sinocyclocheilus grahami TaxID=75366 RepID=A0A672QZL4_SINGR
MCHIPVFCWISAAVLEKMLSRAESGEIPKTLSQMYTHFLILQTNIKREKDYEKKVTDEDMILKLGKLAFQQLVKGNLIFYEEDLRECGIDVTEASVYSGLCTQIFREEFGLYQGKVFCFVHLSIQEHLAALYVHLSCTNNNRNVFEPITKQKHVSLSELHQRAVDEALRSKNGHLDLFLRFLLGLSVESHQILLQQIMTLKRSSSDSNEKIVEYIKKKIRTIDSPEKSINLFHCLNELGDHSLVEEIQQYLKSGRIKDTKLSSSQWSALDDFDMNKFVGGNNEISRLKVFQKLLSDCGVTDEGCAALASALRSNPSHLRELDLSRNKLGDSGVKLLSAGLADPHCKLEKLGSFCEVSSPPCSSVGTVGHPVPTRRSPERECGDEECIIVLYRLSDCGITDEGCASLASALRSNPSHLRELNLTGNKMGNSVNLLSDVLQNTHCKLEILWLNYCGVTDEGCGALASALRSNPSHLRELDLIGNKIGDLGVNCLCTGLKDPHSSTCINLILSAAVCGNACHYISSPALRPESIKNYRHLNYNSHCVIVLYRLRDCGITDEGCAALASALKSNPSHLRELDLTGNTLGDSGVKLLSDLKDDPHYKLEKLYYLLLIYDQLLIHISGCNMNILPESIKNYRHLNYNSHCVIVLYRLRDCGITDEGCAALASALRSNSSLLRHLNLTRNKLGKSGVKLLKENPHYKLETVYCCEYIII